MDRKKFIFNSFFIPLTALSLCKPTGTSLWAVLAISWYVYGLYQRCAYIGINDYLARSLVVLLGLIPIAFIPVWIILLLKDKDAFNFQKMQSNTPQNNLPHQKESRPSISTVHRSTKDYRSLWTVIFLVSSLCMLSFFVPYNTHMPLSVAKSDSGKWNGTVHYSSYFKKPAIIPKHYKQYTDISYGRLAVQEITIVIICGCGYLLTSSKLKK